MTENTGVMDADLEGIDFDESEGSDAARAAAKESGGGGISFRRTYFLSSLLDGSEEGIKAGNDRIYARWLSDFRKNPDNPDLPVWIEANHHSSIPTKSKPDYMDSERSWPKAMGAICRKGKAFVKRYGGDCWICDNVDENAYGKRPFPSSRTWAVGVVREAIISDGSKEMGGPSKKGRKVGFRDKMVEVHKTDENGEIIEGETELVPMYFFAHQAWDNFFQPLAQMGAEYGTIMDRDYLVIREGTRIDTVYNMIPQDPMKVDIGTDDEPMEVDLDLSDNELREALYPDAPNVKLEIARQAGDEHLKRWFLEGELSQDQIEAAEKAGGKSSKGGKSKGSDKSEPKAPASASKSRESGSDVLASMRERLAKRN